MFDGSRTAADPEDPTGRNDDYNDNNRTRCFATKNKQQRNYSHRGPTKVEMVL